MKTSKKTLGKVAFGVLSFSLATSLLTGGTYSEAAANASFKDVGQDHWANKEIDSLFGEQVIKGYPDHTYRPNNAIRREHVAVMFSRTPEKYLDLNPKVSAEKFSDVPVGYTYHNEIEKVQRANIFNGTNGKFRPTEDLTRAQMAKVLTRAFDLKVKPEYNNEHYDFPDVDKKHWANEYVRAMYANGITFGSNGSYKPNEQVTRAQYAAFLYRAIHLNPNFVPKPIDPKPVEPTKPSLPDFMKDNDLFVKDIPTTELALKDQINMKLLSDPVAQQAVRDNGMKYIDARYGVEVRSEGYQNPKEKAFSQLYADGNNKSLLMNFDFRDQRSVNVACAWMKVLYPDFDLTSKIADKSKEATQYEKSGEYFIGNRERIQVGNYEILMGVNSFLEFFQITVEYKG